MSNARKLADNLPSQGSLSGRNLIINGDMSLSQRIGTTATAITGGNYGLDRWHAYYDGNSFTTQQVTDAPSGFYNSMKLLVTGTTTPNYSFFSQKIEGNNVNHIGLGTANCQSFTVSFYVKSSVAGIYSISMTNGAGDLAYPLQYTINSANTWERKTMTIPPITSGTWTKDHTTGLAIRVNLGSPSSRTDTSGAWSSGNFDGADGSTGAVTWATTSGATFYMTGCQIEVGPQSTPFEHEPVGVTLNKCKRYFESKTFNIFMNIGYANITTSAHAVLPYTEKRAVPTVTLPAAGQSTNQLTFLQSNGSFPSSTGTNSVLSTTKNQCRVQGASYSGLTAEGPSALFINGEASATVDAEL